MIDKKLSKCQNPATTEAIRKKEFHPKLGGLSEKNGSKTRYQPFSTSMYSRE